jgi:hypothetical protein
VFELENGDTLTFGATELRAAVAQPVAAAKAA